MSAGVGDFPWDFDDGKIATNSGNGSFGTATDVKACQMVSLTAEMRSGTLSGDGGKRALASKIIGVKGKIRFGGVQQDILAIVLGQTVSSSGTTPNQMKRLPIKNVMNPYFAVCARAKASEGAGDAHLFAPKIKCMSDIEVSFEEENFCIVEFDFEGTYDDYVLDSGTPICMDIIEHETAVAIAIPPTSAGYTAS